MCVIQGGRAAILRRGGSRVCVALHVGVFGAALLLGLTSPVHADLEWRGENLSARGIRKGSGLPTFFLYLDGLHSSFAAQGLSSKTPPWTVFWGLYNQYYYADSLRDDDGREVKERFHISSYTLVQRIFVITPLRTEHINNYFEVIPVFLMSDFRVGGVSASTAGFGDLGIGGGLTFADYHVGDWLEVEAVLGLDVFLPTGHYHPGGLRNLSFNTYSYMMSNDLILHFPRIGNGVYFSPAFYFSGSSENDRFLNPLTGQRSRYQFGPSYQQIFKLTYHLDRLWSVGLAGFFDFQYRDDRMDGSRIKHSAERSQMLGPMVTAVFGRFFLDMSMMREFDQRNRPEGTRFTAILYRVF